MQKLSNYISGKLVDPISGEYIINYDPSIGAPYCLIPDSDERDIEKAVIAAKEAFPEWSAMSNEKRSGILNKIADLIEERAEEFALAECIDNGKPLKLAKLIDIPRGIANFRFFATAVLHFASESHFDSQNQHTQFINYTLRQPIGVVGCIAPWNLPIYLFSWKIAPALAIGNCVIAKPTEVTPMTSYLLSQVCIDAGLPAGVLNIIHGYGHKAGAAITAHKEIKAISFTGGTSTGASIASIAAPMFKKMSLELGGKNPNIIFADCNYDKMLSTTIHSSFSNQGQICLCGSRILVESSIYEKFKTDFINRIQKMKVGDPLSNDSNIGAIVSEAHYNKILACIERAKSEGGKILIGGHTINPEGRCKNGWFIAPTVIEGLDMETATNQEEIFGPVVTIMPFENEEHAVKLANSVQYGLSATIWTQDLSRAHRISARVEAGIIWINCWLVRDLRTPFGGVKNSGLGREGGFEAFKFFTEPKNVCIPLH